MHNPENKEEEKIQKTINCIYKNYDIGRPRMAATAVSNTLFVHCSVDHK
jgi:hypothetical protein